MTLPSVDIIGLQVRFGAVEAVHHLDLSVHSGGATALVGRNGAGKSTTMRVLAGVIPPSAGEVTVCGFDVRRQTLETKRATGYCPDVGGRVVSAQPASQLVGDVGAQTYRSLLV